jgi:hypothetical protein
MATALAGEYYFLSLLRCLNANFFAFAGVRSPLAGGNR